MALWQVVSQKVVRHAFMVGQIPHLVVEKPLWVKVYIETNIKNG
jgi:hypothetical protein